MREEDLSEKLNYNMTLSILSKYCIKLIKINFDFSPATKTLLKQTRNCIPTTTTFNLKLDNEKQNQSINNDSEVG